MKTNVKALLKQIESGQMKNDLSLILNEIICAGAAGLNKNEIGVMLQINDVTVTSRCSDLMDVGIIEDIENEDATLNVYVHQPDPYKQVSNAADRKYNKYIKWKKRGHQDFAEFIKKESKGEPITQLELGL